MGNGPGNPTEAPLPHQRCRMALDRSAGGRNRLSLKVYVGMDMEQGGANKYGKRWTRMGLCFFCDGFGFLPLAGEPEGKFI